MARFQLICNNEHVFKYVFSTKNNTATFIKTGFNVISALKAATTTSTTTTTTTTTINGTTAINYDYADGRYYTVQCTMQQPQQRRQQQRQL